MLGISRGQFECCGFTREREGERERGRGQIGVRVLASDEATPYSGLEARHLPLLPGLAAGRAGASYLASCWQVRPRKLHMWRSRGFPGASRTARPPSHLSIHMHRIWNNTSSTEIDKHGAHTSNIELKDETGFR